MLTKKKKEVILMVMMLVAFSGVEALNNDYEMWDYTMEEDVAQGRFFNLSGGLNSSDLLGVGAAVILAIILFEIALYCLDVYYNNTYGNGGGGGGGGYGHHYNRRNGYWDDSSYQGVPLLYRPNKPYRDPFLDTYYRSLGGSGKFSLDKILHWIAMARKTWETGTEVVTNDECQRKYICEVYQFDLGQLSTRARHSLDMLDVVSYFSLPDQVSNTLDEFQDAKETATTFKDDCAATYIGCPSSLKQLKETYDAI